MASPCVIPADFNTNALNQMLKRVQHDKKKCVIPNLFRNLEFWNDNKLIAFVLVKIILLLQGFLCPAYEGSGLTPYETDPPGTIPSISFRLGWRDDARAGVSAESVISLIPNVELGYGNSALCVIFFF